MIADFERIFNNWSDEIEKILKDIETIPNTDKDAHPKTELQNWRNRMRRLTGISE